MKTQIKYSLSNFIKLLETLILNIGLARVVVDITAFGKLQQYFVLVTFLVTIATAFPTSLNYFISSHVSKSDRESLYKRFFASMFLFAVLSGSLFLCFNSNLEVWFKNDFFTIFTAYFIGIIIFKIINIYFSNYYLFSNKLNYLNLISTLFLGMYFLGFLFFKINGYTIKDILQFFLAYELVKFMVLFIPFCKTFRDFNLNKDVAINKVELKFVLPTMFLVLAGILNMQIDKYMISFMETPEAFAFYQVGAFNIPFIAVITTSFFTIITPEITKFLSQKNFLETLQLTKKTTRQTTLLLLPIVVFCFFFSNQVIILLFGENFIKSGDIFKIYALRFLISVFPFSIYMGIIGLKNYAYIHVIVSAIINIVFNLIFIPKYGIMGAVYATLIASYSTLIIPIIFINKRLKTSFFSYFPIKTFLKVLMVSILLALPFYYINKQYNFFSGRSLYIIPVSIVYYAITIFILEKKFFINLKNMLK